MLPITVDACGCCPSAECTVRVDTSARILEVVTTLCEDPCECVACNDAVAACAVPPLPAGTYRVIANGGAAFSLLVGDPGARPLPPTCTTFAAQAPMCSGDPLADNAWNISSVCAEIPDGHGPEHVRLRLTNECGGCSVLGPCVASVEPRLTDDLPPGGDIRVTASEYFCPEAPDCAAVCMRQERVCALPRLESPGLYRVFVEGRLAFSFNVESLRAEEPACGRVDR